MEVTQQQLDEFYALRTDAARSLANKPLKDNPNVTYGSLLSPKELEFAAHIFSPDIKSRASLIYTPEDIEKIENAVNWEERVTPYNRAPIEYNMEERHPDYMESVRKFNSPEGKERRNKIMIRGNYPEDYQPLEPIAPFGLDKAKEIASLGFDPANELNFDSFTDGAAFRTKVGFAPRNMTVEDYKFIGKQHGLDGEYRYINPSKPNLGVAYRAKGEEDFKLVNTPFVTAEDTYNFLIQEAPAIAGDIALTLYGAKKFTGPTGLTGKVYEKGGKVLGLSGLSAAGAAGGDFLRLTAGYAAGAHDRDLMDILEESGMIGAWAFGGTAVISTASHVIPKVWRMITGKDVPAEFFEKIDDAYVAARETDAATPGLLYGDQISVEQIQNQIAKLSDKFGADFKNGYNPTLSSQAGTVGAADLETLFLKYADDPDLREIYSQIKLGNQEVIDEFIRVLTEKIGPNVGGDVTGATVSEGLRVMAQKDIDAFEDQAYDMIDQVRLQVGGADDAALAGETLLKQVDNPKASSGPIFEREQTRLNQIRKGYVEPFNEAWTTTLNNPRYVNLKTGAGYTRAPAQKWMNARKGESNQLFRSAQGDEAVKELYNLLPGGTRNTINRLRGIGKEGKFESPGFTIDELNSARVALNDFASNLPDGKQGIARLARELERGLEDQMNVLVREGASAESGIAITRKVELDNWMKDNDYGYDLKRAWNNQREAIELSNSQAIRSILENQRPEKIAEYMFNTVAKGSRKNKPMTDLMTVLKREGSDEIRDIQEGLAAYIQREVLDSPDLKPLQIAKKYRTFIKENEGTLRAVFGDEQFKARFSNPKSFQRTVIRDIEKLNDDVTRIQARFGMANIGDPDKQVTNIVESILATGKTQKQSGRILEDIEYLRTITKNNPELEEQVAQVTKRYLLQDIIQPRRGGGYEINENGLNKLIKEGFGPEDITGPRLTFESFIEPMLGKGGKDFVENLRFLDNLVQRELGAAPSEGVVRALNLGEYPAGSALEGARILQRLLIAPLTQTGRRITAISNSQAERSRKFIGRMLLDEELFNKTVQYAKGRVNTQNFIRFLSSYSLVAAQDLGEELKFYDEIDKKQKTPEDKELLEIPERILNVSGGST